MESNIKSMKRIMKYAVTSSDMGLLLKLNEVWNGEIYFLFKATGMSDSDFTKDDSKKSVNGWSNFLNGASTSFRRKLMRIITLSVM